MLHQDGPEYGTLQYAEDGINFEIKGQVNDFVLMDYSSDYPEAAGLYRPVSDEVSPVSGVSWGLCHVLTREQGPLWMYLKRFENVDKQFVIDDANNNGIELGSTPLSTVDSTETDNQFNIYPNPVKDLIHITIKESSSYFVEIISLAGQTIKKDIYESKTGSINISDLGEGFYILKLVNANNNKTYYKSFVKRNHI